MVAAYLCLGRSFSTRVRAKMNRMNVAFQRVYLGVRCRFKADISRCYDGNPEPLTERFDSLFCTTEKRGMMHCTAS
jgi:hypothetical protein